MANQRTSFIEHKSRALAMRAEGYTYDQISQELGCSPSLIGRWAREAGMRTRTLTLHTAAVRRAAINRYLAGESAPQIARKLGISTHTTICKWLTEEGIPIRGSAGYVSKRRVPEPFVAFCCQMYDQGYTHGEIGEMVGRHATAIGKIMRQAGRRPRSKHEQMKIAIAKGRHPRHLKNKHTHAKL